MAYQLGPRDESWDGGAAEKSYDLPQDKNCWMYRDPNGDPNSKSSYKLPFVSKDGGEHAVWRAITAIAQRLPSADIPDEAKGHIRNEVASYYKQAAEKYNDNSIQVPWARSMFSPHPDILEYERRYGKLGEVEHRLIPLMGIETRDTGEGGYNVTGLASVFNSRSLDLGGFTEEIAPGAFDEVLSRNPDVHLLWDHDTRLVLARTRNNTLKLGVDAHGLSYYGRVAPTSYAADLRLLLDRGDVDQASFAFTVGDQEWSVSHRDNGEDQVLRTITRVDELYDCTITATGAYPAATSSIARSYVRSYARIEPEIVVPELVAPEEVQRSKNLALAKSRARARARVNGVKRDLQEQSACPNCDAFNESDAEQCHECGAEL